MLPRVSGAKAMEKTGMRKAGYYWVQFHDYGAVRAVRWKNRAWHYDHDVTDADLKVMDGPLLPPSVEDLARQPEHLARVVAADWEHVGCDPRRDGHHVDGTYWVSFRGKKPVLAELFEDYWMSVDRTDGEFAWNGPLTAIQPTMSCLDRSTVHSAGIGSRHSCRG